MSSWIAVLQKRAKALKEPLSKDVRESASSSVRVLYHIALLILSAWIAISLPWMAETFLAHRSRLQDQTEFIVACEIAITFLLLVLLDYLWKSVSDRKVARMAKAAGLALFFSKKDYVTQKTIARLKHRHGVGRNVMIIGSTGSKTFVDPEGDLHDVLKDCLEARILLLNPYSEEARIRATTLQPSAEVIGDWNEQVRRAVQFLKSLKLAQKNIKLKLYHDYPHVKLVILGDHIWVQHYHPTQDIQTMPEYVFSHTQQDHGLYALFYQHFVKRWESQEIPEYDLETDELVYHSARGSEQRREPFNWDGGGRSGTGEHLFPNEQVCDPTPSSYLTMHP
ncbi:MAG: hypothetical protein ACREJN_03030 [Nitrospiraceae bacterium]